MEQTEQTDSQEAPELPPVENKEPSRFNIFMRKMLRWSTGVLAIFVLGIILTWVVQVNPRIKRVSELEGQLDAIRAELQEAETLLGELRQVEAENQALQTNLENGQIHLTLMSVLVDVSAAQLALFDNNLDEAQLALSETEANVDILIEKINASDRVAMESIRERLTLAINEMSQNSFAAQSDLEVLKKSLLTLENSLFGE